MRYIAIYNTLGQYIEYGNEGIDFPAIGQMHYVGHINIDTQYHDLETNKPKNKPPKPSVFHNFDYVTKTWVLAVSEAWEFVKFNRNKLLTDTDWRVTKSMETGVPIEQSWLEYRQALRDITSQADPENIVWPIAPLS